MAPRHPKRPTDANQLGKLIVELSTGEREEPVPQSSESAATEFARQGGMKGGEARAASLTADERRGIAKRAAQARWKKEGGE